MNYKFRIFILLFLLFLFSCKKGLISTPETKIKGNWELKSVTVYTNYRLFRNGIMIDSLDVYSLQPNRNENLFYNTGQAIDYYQLGDKWFIADEDVTLKSGNYKYQYLTATNYVKIFVGNTTNRSFNVEKLDKNNLQLISPTQTINIEARRYFILNFSK